MLPKFPKGDTGCRRTTGRRSQEDLTSSLGPVLDLSRGGMRVLADRKPRGEFDLKLIALEQTIALRGRVAWTQRIGFRKHVVGIEFVNLPEAVARTLTEISSHHGTQHRRAG